MSLASSKLGNQGHHRSGMRSLTGQAPERHPGMLAQSPGKEGAGKELPRVPVVLGGASGDNLLQVDGKFIRVERASLPDSLRENLLPYTWFHSESPLFKSYFAARA